MNQNRLHATLTILCLTFITATSFGQDFQGSYALAPGNRVSVKNVVGNIAVKGYDGTTIMVTAYKEGRDRELSKIVDSSTSDKVEVKVEYPQDCNCDASVRFEVLVPRNTNYDYDSFSSVGGNIAIEEIVGTLRTDSNSGGILINNTSYFITSKHFHCFSNLTHI